MKRLAAFLAVLTLSVAGCGGSTAIQTTTVHKAPKAAVHVVAPHKKVVKPAVPKYVTEVRELLVKEGFAASDIKEVACDPSGNCHGVTVGHVEGGSTFDVPFTVHVGER